MGGRTTFPRVSGSIVLESFSIVSFFTGLLAAVPAGLLLLVDAAGPRSSGVGAAVSVIWGLTVLVFVSRFAQVGIAGDIEGGFFSSTAGPWSGTMLAAARLLLLWVVWALPFIAWALVKGEPQAPTGLPGMAAIGIPHVPLLLSIWSAAGIVLAFAFVAVSASAPGFGDLFAPGLWRTLFSGRLGELFVVIAGTFGPPAAVLVVVLPVVGALALVNPKLALTLFVPFVIYAAGMVLTLQGKLGGTFAAASLAEEAEEVEPVVATPEAAAVVPAAVVSGPAVASAAATPRVPAPGDPRALHAAWQARLAEGDGEGAIAAARAAIPAGLEKGEPKLAAEVYRHHLDRISDLGLDRAALDALADQLLHDGDVAAAAWTFSQALDAQPTDPKAFKGLLRVAEHHLEKGKEAFEAVRVYRYLLERAPASPFADHARDLLVDAERKAARPASPQG